MMKSMTAFARVAVDAEWGSAVWELRSVNHRYLDIFIRLPDDLRGFENVFRQTVSNELTRGKVECNLRYHAPGGAQQEVNIDQGVVAQVIGALKDIEHHMDSVTSTAAIDVLRWPGVIQAPGIDQEALKNGLLEALKSALAELQETRAREGETIHRFMHDKLDAMLPEIEAARTMIPELVDAQREKLRNKLAELKAEVDENRIEQEIVILAQKIDVTEELERLVAHVDEVRRVIDAGKPAGRRLDFLMQELNREANTLASKSAAHATTKNAVELKVIIEQMREQVQNIE